MPTETTIAPAKSTGTVTLDAPHVPEARPPGAPRARNEYPEAYDELEGLEAAAPAKDRAKPLEVPTDKSGEKERDESGKFVKQAQKAALDMVEDVNKRASELPGSEKVRDKPSDEKAEAESKPSETPAPDAEPDPTAKYQLAHDLRKAFRKLHKEHDALKSEVVTLRTRSQSKPDEAVLNETKELRKRLDEAEQELRYLDYTKSSEFRDKYTKPYENALNDAVEEVKELHVLDENGNPLRPATEGDLRKILTADKSEVRSLAKQLFGEDAQDVLAIRRKLDDLNRNANREAREYREKAAEREKQRALKASEEREGMERLWKTKVSEVAERYKQFFGKLDGDDEYNAMLEDGYKRLDAAHAPDLPMEEKITRLAVARHKAAAFGAQVLLNKRLQGRVKELEEALKEYEKSVPASGKGGKEERTSGSAESNGFKSAEDELDELDRKFPGDR